MKKSVKKHPRLLAGILLAFAAILLGVLIWLSARKEHYTMHRYVYFDVLDTVSTITVYLTDDQDSSYYENWIHEQLLAYHRLFDAYNSYDGLNNVYTINENAGIQPVSVDEELYELIRFCLDNREAVSGRTNIAFGTVTSIWKQFMSDASAEQAAAKEEGRDPVYTFPSSEQLSEAEKHTDMDCIRLDEENHTVYLTDPDMCLDVGAVAKGYIAEKLAARLKEAGIVSACLDLGGNLKILGERKADDGRTYFTSSIADPTNPTAHLSLVLRLDDGVCVVTSGNYQRFVDIDGVRYCHLIDPDTLQPAHGMNSVTIIASDSGLADYLSTALFTVDMETGQEILSHYEGVEAFWITEDLQVSYTEGFEKYLVE